jgi:hypothetical protein
MLGQWILDGELVQLIMLITAIEVAVLVVYHRMTGRGIPPRFYLLNVVSGLFLMLAVWFALAKQPGPIALFLAAAGLAHAADLIHKWKRR